MFYFNSAVVLFLVYPVERNIYDQRWLEYSIHDKDSRVRVVRKSMKDVQLNGQLSTDRRLLVYVNCCLVFASFPMRKTTASRCCRLSTPFSSNDLS